MDAREPIQLSVNRRHFLGRTGFGLASAALSTLDASPVIAAISSAQVAAHPAMPTVLLKLHQQANVNKILPS